MEYDTNFEKRRSELSSDSYRPAFHYVAPYGWMNDPNGTVFWKGRWHLFFQYSPTLIDTGAGVATWGHAVSDDFVHWRDLPIAIAPTPGTCDERGCWSGTSYVEDDKVVAVYYAYMGGLCIATCSDELLIDWEKLPENPIAPLDRAKTYDPCIWKEGNTYYTISGRITGATFGHGQDQQFGGKDIAYIYKSDNLKHWDYDGVFYEGGVFTQPCEDCACPNFFPIGDKYMLLFCSHNQGVQYYIGDYADGRFTPLSHGRMNFTVPMQPNLSVSGDLAAPISWDGPNGRRVVIAWVAEGRARDAMFKAGWAGIMSLPRDISLESDYSLKIEPIKELEVLRKNHRAMSKFVLKSQNPKYIDNVYSNTFELNAIIDTASAKQIGLKVCKSANGEEETVIIVDIKAGTITIDPSHASISADVIGKKIQTAPFSLKQDEALELRVFVDRSIVEVFANNRQCVTKRIYPAKPDSLSVQFFANGGDCTINSLDVWDMDSIWPE